MLWWWTIMNFTIEGVFSQAFVLNNMAPWPAQGNEPKAPDRNKSSDNRTIDNLKSKSEPPEDKKPSKGVPKEDQVKNIVA